MTLPWLTEDELEALTGYKRRSEQVKELVSQGIPHRNGKKLIVGRNFLDEDYAANDSKRKKSKAGPDLSAVG